MSDVSGGAAAPAEVTPEPVEGAPINEVGANFTNPLGSQIPPEAQGDQSKPEPKAASLDDSIDRAIAKSNEQTKAKAAAEKPEPEKAAKEPAKAEQPRENGKFVAKELKEQPAPKAEAKTPEPAKPSFTASEAPARFSADAKAKWAETHESVRGETERAIRELTEGHAKYKTAAERDAGIAEFHELATKSGTTVKDALTRYVGMENQLKQDLVKGLDLICQNRGVSLKDVAAHIMGQTPEQNASQQDATIRELRSEISDLKNQVGGVKQTFEKQQSTAVGKEVTEFAAAHPRFDELSQDIAFFLQTRCPGDLSEAYKLAERLNPAPAAASETVASTVADVDLSIQPEKGRKSITGAPSSGSSPSGKKRVALSLDESLDKAFGSLG